MMNRAEHRLRQCRWHQFYGHLHQCGGQWRCHRLAVGDDQADRVDGGGLDDRDGADGSVRPSVSASRSGINVAHWPVRIWENRTIIELDSSVGAGLVAGVAQQPSMMRRFCMSGVSRQSGIFADLGPGHLRPGRPAGFPPRVSRR